jgi:mannose-6-phosphate isomerase-like protein (cupin superfamily)
MMASMQTFETARTTERPAETAPDGSRVRPLLRLAGGSMAHFELAAGGVSTAVMHRQVEEIWYFLGGRGEMWRKLPDREEVVVVEAGTCLTTPPAPTSSSAASVASLWPRSA